MKTIGASKPDLPRKGTGGKVVRSPNGCLDQGRENNQTIGK
jgi:hypothetical protein